MQDQRGGSVSDEVHTLISARESESLEALRHVLHCHCPASGPAAQPQVRVASTDPLTRARALVAAVAAEVAAAGAAAEAAAILAATLGPDGRLQIH